MDKTKAIIEDESKKSKSSKRIIDWAKKHKKELIIAGVSITLIGASAVGIKNEDAIKKLWNNIKEEYEKMNLYSSDWFAKATDSELTSEREKVRIDFCSSGDDYCLACRLQNLLWIFDEEINKRAWGDEIPHGPNIHREHGRYLPNDD